MKKILISILTLAILLSSSLSIVSAATVDPNGIAFSIDHRTDDQGKIAITVSTDQAAHNVGGLRLILEFDPLQLRYVEGSGTIVNSQITQDYSLAADTGAVVLSWAPVLQGAELPAGELVKMSLQSIGAEQANASVTLKILDFHQYDKHMTEIPVKYEQLPANISVKKESVEAVETLIGVIGEVAYTDTCKQKIDAARAAYNALSVIERRNVANFEALVQAEQAYARLEKDDAGSQTAAAAAAYRETHKAILAKDKDSLTLEDKAALDAAFLSYEEATIHVQIQLVQEKNLLNRLKNRMDELLKIAQDEAYENQLRKEAQDLAEEFRAQNAPLLAVTVDRVDPAQKSGIEGTLQKIAGLEMVNSYVSESLKEEKDHLNALLEKIKQIENTPEEEESAAQKLADSFNMNFGYFYAVTEEEATADMLLDLTVAVTLWDMLDYDVRSIIGLEKGDVLNDLLAVVQQLAEQPEPTDPQPTEPTTPAQTGPQPTQTDPQPTQTDPRPTQTDPRPTQTDPRPTQTDPTQSQPTQAESTAPAGTESTVPGETKPTAPAETAPTASAGTESTDPDPTEPEWTEPQDEPSSSEPTEEAENQKTVIQLKAEQISIWLWYLVIAAVAEGVILIVVWCIYRHEKKKKEDEA